MKGLTEKQARVLALLPGPSGWVTVTAMAIRTGFPVRSLHSHLDALEDRGLALSRTTTHRGGWQRVAQLTALGQGRLVAA